MGEGQVLVSMLNEVGYVIANMSRQSKMKIIFKKRQEKNSSYRITVEK
jgi:hypothetical protein